MKEVRVFLNEDEHSKFKSKVALNGETMQSKLYEFIIKYLMEK